MPLWLLPRLARSLGTTRDPVLTVGSFFPCIYYGFYCAPHFQKFYLTLISLAGVGKF